MLELLISRTNGLSRSRDLLGLYKCYESTTRLARLECLRLSGVRLAVS
jgi:hypothetical protein